ADAKGKEELEPLILKKAKVVVDALAQARHSGEINVPLSKNLIKESDIYASIADVVVKKKKGRVSKDEITVFDSTGLAIQDVAVASFIYKEANKRGLGKSIRGLVL
ncbi:MAG: ornithine cyclodeaminase family protein, partial [Candidatus Omnitrophica bacterium]|nr:ornithine cyclodeaminase family protein [Candidatus Omnitrophota bacterium]